MRLNNRIVATAALLAFGSLGGAAIAAGDGTQSAPVSAASKTTVSRAALAQEFGVFSRPARAADRLPSWRRGTAARASRSAVTRLAFTRGAEEYFVVHDGAEVCVVVGTSEMRVVTCGAAQAALEGEGPILGAPGKDRDRIVAMLPDDVKSVTLTSKNGAAKAATVTNNLVVVDAPKADTLSWSDAAGRKHSKNVAMPDVPLEQG